MPGISEKTANWPVMLEVDGRRVEIRENGFIRFETKDGPEGQWAETSFAVIEKMIRKEVSARYWADFREDIRAKTNAWSNNTEKASG